MVYMKVIYSAGKGMSVKMLPSHIRIKKGCPASARQNNLLIITLLSEAVDLLLFRRLTTFGCSLQQITKS